MLLHPDKVGNSETSGRELLEGGGEFSGRRRQSFAKSLGNPGFQTLSSLHHRTLSPVFDWEGVSISFFTKVLLMYTPT